MKDPANPSIWHDIGDEKARDKTSQALREMALTVRRQLEEDFRKAQQANAALAGVATNKGPPPPPPDSSAAPMVWRGSQPVYCQPIQQQTQQQLLQQPPLEEFPSIDDSMILDIMWSSKHQYNQEDDAADPSMEWGLM
jgi:hypothetical protein